MSTATLVRGLPESLYESFCAVVVRDMISRHDFWWPKYGILPGMYGEPGNDGCPLTIYWSMVGALEMGAYEYARGVLEVTQQCCRPRL